jgi:hypothetical protein
MVERKRPPAVLVFGEDQNDREVLCALIGSLRPDLEKAARPLRQPLTLVKGAGKAVAARRSGKLIATVRAYAVKEPVRCVFLHEDTDDFEPSHQELVQKIETNFGGGEFPVYAAVPAWEMETWLFLFPEAIATYRPSWRSIGAYKNRDLGKIRNAKENLRKSLQPPGRSVNVREYEESDSPRIVRIAAEKGLVRPPWFAKCESWLLFVSKVEGC